MANTPYVIDLSRWNTIPELDGLQQAAADGCVGVIHKATQGSSLVDKKLEARAHMVKEAGLLFGLYHYLSGDSKIEAQVNHFVATYEKYGDTYTLLAADHEERNVSLDALAQFLEGVEVKTGKRPVIYSGHVLKEQLGSKRHGIINGDNYLLWIAQYGPKVVLPTGFRSYLLWQYTDRGSVPGISGNVDKNNLGVSLGDLSRLWTQGAAPEPKPEPGPEPEQPDTGDKPQKPGTSMMDIGKAVAAMEVGRRMTRPGWNGKGMWVALAASQHANDGTITLPFLYMRTVTGEYVPWFASQQDILAKDWTFAE